MAPKADYVATDDGKGPRVQRSISYQPPTRLALGHTRVCPRAEAGQGSCSCSVPRVCHRAQGTGHKACSSLQSLSQVMPELAAPPLTATRAALLAPMPARLGWLIPHPSGSKGLWRSVIINIVCCSGEYSLSLTVTRSQYCTETFVPTPRSISVPVSSL